MEAPLRTRHKSEAAEIERSYEALRRLDRHELKSFVSGRTADTGWHRSWIAKNNGDFDGLMTTSKQIARARYQRSAAFDQHLHLIRRHELRYGPGV